MQYGDFRLRLVLILAMDVLEEEDKNPFSICGIGGNFVQNVQKGALFIEIVVGGHFLNFDYKLGAFLVISQYLIH